MVDGSILIVGAGPSGLAMACALGKQGVVARIVDAAQGPGEDSRAIGIQARSMEIFDTWGVADEFVARGVPIHGVRLYGEDKKLLVYLKLWALPSQFPYVLALQQSETEEILTRHIQELGFNIERETKVNSIRYDSDSCLVTFGKLNGETEEARFNWVIGCDGAHSTVRDCSHTPFSGKEYPQQFLLADLRIDWPLAPNEAHIFTAANGILACFPIPGGHYRVIATKTLGDHGGSPPDINEIRRVISERGPSGATVDDLIWSSNFFIHSRLVDSLQRGRSFLVGDAAHIHSPALAQGMNTGIQDAANLAWKLALVVKGQADPVLLESYDIERWPVEKGVLSQTDFVTNVMGGQNRFWAWPRDHIGPLIMANDRIASHIRELVSELAIDYRGSQLVTSAKGDWDVKAGDRVPDAILEKDGNSTRLYDLLRGAGHHLILIGDKDKLANLSIPQLDDMTTHFVKRPDDEATDGFLDSRGDIESTFGWDRAYLIRPDAYVGAVSDFENLQATLAEYAKQIHAVPAMARPRASLM